MNDETKEILEYLKNNFYAYGDTYIEEKCKIVTKKGNHQLLDYITNLQEENEKNKEYSEFYKDMSDKWKDMSNVFKKNCEDYKSRNEKAIEYIWSTKYEYGDLEEDNEDFDIDVYELLNILNGGYEE